MKASYRSTPSISRHEKSDPTSCKLEIRSLGFSCASNPTDQQVKLRKPVKVCEDLSSAIAG